MKRDSSHSFMEDLAKLAIVFVFVYAIFAYMLPFLPGHGATQDPGFDALALIALVIAFVALQ